MSSVDTAGQITPSAPLVVAVPDTAPPTAPSGVSAIAVSGSDVTIGWAASADDVGVTGYRVLRDGAVAAIVGPDALSFRDTGRTPGGVYTYAVAAVDAAGNVSAATAAPPVSTPAPRSLVFPALADATVASSPNGSGSRLAVDASPLSDMLLRFAVNGTSGCRITSAKLALTVGSSSDDASVRGGDFRLAASSSWTESAVTLRTAPAGVGSAVSLGAVAKGARYLVNLTQLIPGDGTFTVRASNPSADAARFYSREGTSDPTKRPQLLVTCS